MKAPTLRLLILFSLLTLSNSVLAFAPPKVGELHSMKEFKVLHGEVDIDASNEIVWAALTDYPNLKHALPNYSRSNLLSTHGNQSVVELGLKINPFIPELRYQVRITEAKNRELMSIERISGDFDALIGSYKLSPLNNNRKQTHLSYDLKIDFGIPVPGVSFLMRSNMLKDLKDLQAYCQKNSQNALAHTP